MKYHNISKDDMLNGEGIRVVLWLSGCSHKCKDCHNPITWDEHNGLQFTQIEKQEIFNELDKDYISGITFSGGDPLFINNRHEVLNFISEIKQKYSNKNIWLYTGYVLEDILEWNLDISGIDILIDGKFNKDLYNANLHWVGSSNQRIIDVKKTLKENKMVLYNEE